MDQHLKIVKQQAKILIHEDRIPDSPTERVSEATKTLLQGDYCVDVHTHFFDKHCVNASYVILKKLGDFLRWRGDAEQMEEEFIEMAYKTAHVFKSGYDEKLSQVVEEHDDRRDGRSSLLTMALRKSTMRQVYDYYIRESSLADYFGLKNDQILTTVLMMDFKMGWELDVRKSMRKQIKEQKELALEKPVLPFLFCDPRRINLPKEDQLYEIFNEAFATENPFFGVKLYPCLGYDPSDYRLWPIYEICEKKNIPVLSHCGGDTVSTPHRSISVFQGTKKVTVEGDRRKDVSYQLNDPARWKLVLEKFPNLRLNIAHFGSEATWSSTKPVDKKIDPQQRKEIIMDLMNKYPHVYSDFSYTIADEQASRNFIRLLKKDDLLQERSMFGSDFWVVYYEGSLKENQKEFLDMVGDDKLRDRLCKRNPMQYLFGTDRPF
ncbi:MAG: amidohydrolase family protein [Bacteroidota bacterium]